MKKTNEYLLVYGATGLVGQELVNTLNASGNRVVVLARNQVKAKKLFADTVYVSDSIADIIRLNTESNLICHAIVNLAGANIGAKRWTDKYKKDILTSRLHALTLLEEFVAQLEQKPKVWIQASAIGYYGSIVPELTDESGEKGQGFLSDIVEKWEREFQKLALPETRKVTFRLGVVLSGKGGFLQQMIRVSNFGVVALPYIPKQKLTWIHLTDLVNLIGVAIRENVLKGAVNAVASEPANMDDLKNLLLKKTRALLKLHFPKVVFYLMLGKEKTTEMVLANQQVFSSVLPMIGFKYEFNSIAQVFNSEN